MRASFPRYPFARPELIISGIMVMLGLMVTSGWLLHVPRMVEIKSGLVPMVFNTGLCFLLAGAAIALMPRSEPAMRHLRQGIGAALVLLCSLTLIELLRDHSLFGIDLPSLHTWYDYGNTRPGRMAPNTALGFILIGAAIILTDRVAGKNQALSVVFLTFGILAIGLTGLVGYLMAPDLLFGWARSARMAVHTATGMILCAIALWLTWSKSEWYGSSAYFREDTKIRFLGAAILMVVTVTVGLVGFVLLQKSLEKSLENALQVAVLNRTSWFLAVTEEVAQSSQASVQLSGLDDAARALLVSRDDPARQSHVAAIARRLTGAGFRGVAILDASGKTVTGSGRLALQAEIAAPLNQRGSSQLVWDTELVLRTRLPVVDGHGDIGIIAMDRAVPELNKALFDTSKLGQTGESAACVSRSKDLLCFPGSRHTSPFAVAQRSIHGQPLPVELALAGRSGIVYAMDYRDKNVVAGYGLLAPGLGFVVKQDTVEVYAVIREALAIGAPVILGVALLGALLLYSQLQPLAARMRKSEQAAAEKELEIRTIMQAAGDGILTIDSRGVIQAANTAVCQIFGYDADALIGNNITMLIPPDMRQAHRDGMARVGSGGAPRLLGTPNVHVSGLHMSGVTFPLELTINAVPLTGKQMYVGVMRDITERMKTEGKLTYLAQYDSLTGLPNRTLFMDRLGTAALRAKRSWTALALMFIDLDGFKNINDTMGHAAGDELLVQFAQRLASMVRKTDTVARLAGDEFTVILEELAQPNADAEAVAQKIVESMQRAFLIAGREVTITASIGLVVHDGREGAADVTDLLKRADREMYAAKHSGKNAFSAA